MRIKTLQSKNLWDSATAILRLKYITIQAFLKKLDKPQIHNLTLYLKKLERKQQIKLNPSRREIIKIRAEINETETERRVEHINKS